jgi:prophage regulatory protein
MLNTNNTEATHSMDSYLRWPQVQPLVGGLSRQWIYLLMKDGKFPKPVKVGRRAIAWRVKDIQAWVDKHLMN